MALVVAGGVRVDEERPQQRHLEEQEGERRQREEQEKPWRLKILYRW